MDQIWVGCHGDCIRSLWALYLPLLTSPKGQLLPPGPGQASAAAVEVALPSQEGGHVPSAGELSPGRSEGEAAGGGGGTVRMQGRLEEGKGKFHSVTGRQEGGLEPMMTFGSSSEGL